MEKIPIADLKRQIRPIRKELDAAIRKVIDNANFILGQEVEDFEDRVAQYCDVKYAVGVSNGTDAIRLSLLALDIRPGEGVLCPAFTYYATAGSISSIGAIPLFTDIDPDTYNISPSSLDNQIIKQGQRIKIKAIIPVHLYGQCADMDSILKIAQSHGLKVIEDAAQAFGAEYLVSSDRLGKCKKAGTIADCGAVSFYPGKNLGAFGDAGMVITNNAYIAERVKILRNQGDKGKYYHLMLGHNHRMDTLQAAVLQVKLKYLDAWNKKRQENAKYFNQNLRTLTLKTPLVARYSTHIYHQYVLRLGSSSAKLIEYLKSKGIDARLYYPLPLHLQECFSYLGYRKGDFPESENAAEQTLAIPVYPDLTRRQLDYIVTSIREFFK